MKAGDVIRVHVHELPDLWKVDEVLHAAGTWGYFLKISQRVDGARVERVIAAMGFELVNFKEDSE